MVKQYIRILGLFTFGVLGVISFAATLIPFVPAKQWYIRIFDYPRLQTFCIAVFALAWYFAFYYKRGRRGYIFVFMFGVVIIIQAYKAWPYTFVGHKQVLRARQDDADRSISLLVCNVFQPNTHYASVIKRIRQYNPDIFITTESDSIWQKQLVSLEETYPFRVPVPQSNTYGMHLYSRFPLDESSIRFLVERDIPSIRTKVKLPSGEWITLFIVHPRPPVPTEASDSRERDAEIIMVAKEARKEKGAVIVAGDFNDVAWSETTELFQRVSGFLDPRRGRGFYNTFHANIPIFRWPLDHIFHSSHFKLIKMERVGRVNSDHFPMFIHLSYEPEQKHEQPKVKPDSKTQEKARETIQKGKGDPDPEGK